ncbi:MAG: tRNA (5-methylaminomethyl-2-thiouridine)(34)-methyltransferase MnmD [Prevotellaceae bacterium]|jgi:tRNA U34 5-methylaminomethyl-2-thiouridine-forming methyltransferase MnmC|nr:tRNA (5-methylaminomethyl-2-thiouridine)(34)-methyltransferase MnmD [Prevotellaceae bacterium]
MSDMRIISTADGSHTLQSLTERECYHSINGALQESRHVFIDAGLRKVISQQPLNVLEVGFGTGLNALLTLLQAEKTCRVFYEAVEKYPVAIDIIDQLNYCDVLEVDKEKYFKPLHFSGWSKNISITDTFVLKKCHTDLLHYTPSREDFNLVYFDAFSPDSQPELWSVEIFSTIYQHMKKGGVLVTYSSKGLVKQSLRSVGFTVERLAGAPGKRHMLRATK